MQRHESVKKTDVSVRRPEPAGNLSANRRIPTVDILISNKIKQFQEAINESDESGWQDKINKQRQEATINVTNVIIVGHGERFKSKLAMDGFCRQINLEADEQGNLQVNGRKMEAKEILDGIKIYVIR